MIKKTLLVVALCVSSGVLAASMAHGASPYDGDWWLARTEQERGAFLDGERDCYIFDVRGTSYSAAKVGVYGARRITSYYTSSHSRRKESVLGVIRRVFLRRNREHFLDPQSERNAEQYPEKHGIFDGYYWRQIGENRPYFVRGYLACRVRYLHTRVAWSIGQYVLHVDKWYGIGPDDSDDGSVDRDNDKIGNILDALFIVGSK